MKDKAAFVYDPSMSQHVLREGHPMQPMRLQYTYQLLEAYDAFDDSRQLVRPRPATMVELASFHTQEYIEAVKNLSLGEMLENPARFNFSTTGDNPLYPGMYDAAVLSTGASVVAAELVARGEVKVAFNISGGLHHAAPGHASGFCVFNDPVIAINHLLDQGLKVAYVDIDAHHGDGVQGAFYDTDQVMTISTHESGQFLFPGTGFVEEIGSGVGRGYSVNLPFFPYTGDNTYIWAFREAVIPLLDAFDPDVLVTQLGIDTHYKDPITHLRLTSKAFGQAVQEVANLGLPWIALGGGGYDVGAVARCWTIAFGVMTGRAWPQKIPSTYAGADDLEQLDDYEQDLLEKDLQNQIDACAQTTVLDVKRLLFRSHGLL